MVKTHGLMHNRLTVLNPERSPRFYRQVFGVMEYYRDEPSIQVQGPGSHDFIAFEKKAKTADVRGGIPHFGLRLVRPEDIDAAVEEVRHAGGTLLHRGEFGPGSPYACVHDPDACEIEIWHESRRARNEGADPMERRVCLQGQLRPFQYFVIRLRDTSIHSGPER